jgi:hypothetical protein
MRRWWRKPGLVLGLAIGLGAWAAFLTISIDLGRIGTLW